MMMMMIAAAFFAVCFHGGKQGKHARAALEYELEAGISSPRQRHGKSNSKSNTQKFRKSKANA